MPAMSPTMTEGNISSWKVKEGDSFAVGDVLLEIETDKASMDVEAQDDGVMAKIFAQDGSKGVKVGTRIALLADEGDDISNLELPPDESKPAPQPSEDAPKKEESTKDIQASKPPAGTPQAPRPSRSKPTSSPSGPGQNTKYPLYPSVIALIHENHLSDTDVSKIPATGPNQRLLKGDVLAYLGSINADYSSKQSKRIKELSHLDLSNIKVMPPTEKSTPMTGASATPSPEPISATSVSLPISLVEVLKVQKKIQDSLGVPMPLSTFLARAVDIANDDLPKSKGAKLSADELFDAVLGLDTISSTSRGAYIPQITAVPSPTALTSAVAKTNLTVRQPDIIDILSGRATSRPVRAVPTTSVDRSIGSAGAMNLFTITVPVGEEKRARTFLERMKTVLQVEPGRLVL